MVAVATAWVCQARRRLLETERRASLWRGAIAKADGAPELSEIEAQIDEAVIFDRVVHQQAAREELAALEVLRKLRAEAARLQRRKP